MPNAEMSHLVFGLYTYKVPTNVWVEKKAVSLKRRKLILELTLTDQKGMFLKDVRDVLRQYQVLERYQYQMSAHLLSNLLQTRLQLVVQIVLLSVHKTHNARILILSHHQQNASSGNMAVIQVQYPKLEQVC